MTLSTPSVPRAADPQAAARRAARRSGRLKTLHQWHWISSALCLVGMLLFAVTGITLNHASDIVAKPSVVVRTGQLPPALLDALVAESRRWQDGGPAGAAAPSFPGAVRDWLRAVLDVTTTDAAVEWSADEAYLAMPRPGGDAWLRIGLADGAVEFESTDRGWIAYFNDLHKGRHSGLPWSWFIDLFSVACVVFSVTGLLILQLHAGNRPLVWPIVGLGVVIPALLAILFVH